MESWLRPNRRAVALGVLPWIASCGLGSWLMLQPSFGWLVRGLGLILAVISLASILSSVWAMRSPRVAYRDDELLLFLGALKPVRLPIEIVECFFLGQGPSGVRDKETGDDLESRNIVVRLAERATEWHQGEVRRRIGKLVRRLHYNYRYLVRADHG